MLYTLASYNLNDYLCTPKFMKYGKELIEIELKSIMNSVYHM